MSYDKIKLDYGLAEDMAKAFQQGGEQLQDTMQELQSIANMLEEGALLGRGGETYVDGIRSKLCPALSRFIEKFQQMEKDIHGAISDMREADQEASGMFGS